MIKKHKGVPNIGKGVQIGYVKPDLELIKGKSRYKCAYYNEESKRCSALNYITCVGVNHKMCKYLEEKDLSREVEKPVPSGIVNNGSIVILKEINTGKEVKVNVNSHKNPEHKKLLGKNLKTNAIVEDWGGGVYLVWKIKH